MPSDKTWTYGIYAEACDVLEAEGFTAGVRTNYSGRGMYGAAVPAIETDAPAVMVGYAITVALIAHRHERGDTDLVSLLDGSSHAIPRRSDQMGRDGFVYY